MSDFIDGEISSIQESREGQETKEDFQKIEKIFGELIEDYLKSFHKTEESNLFLEGIIGKAKKLEKKDFEDLLEYINTRRKKETGDNKLQLLELWSTLINIEESKQNEYTGRIDYREQIRELPENVNLRISQGIIYNNGDNTPDYYEKSKTPIVSQNIIDGLQQNETGEITFDFGNVDMGKYNSRIKKTVTVSYVGDFVTFEYNGYFGSIVVNRKDRNKKIPIILGDIIYPNEIGKKHGKFIKFDVILNWR